MLRESLDCYASVENTCDIQAIHCRVYQRKQVINFQLDQWRKTSGPRVTSGPRRVLMWPAVSNKNNDYFKPRHLVCSGTV